MQVENDSTSTMIIAPTPPSNLRAPSGPHSLTADDIAVPFLCLSAQTQ
jgi:hypothetical protein